MTPPLPFSRGFPKSKNLQEDVTKNITSVTLGTKGSLDIGSLDSLISQKNKMVAGPKVPYLTLSRRALSQYKYFELYLFFNKVIEVKRIILF